jgi:hypothetical protein
MTNRQSAGHRPKKSRTFLAAVSVLVFVLTSSTSTHANSDSPRKPNPDFDRVLVQGPVLLAQTRDENQHNIQSDEQLNGQDRSPHDAQSDMQNDSLVNAQIDAQIDAQIEAGPGDDIADNGSDLEAEEMTELASELSESFSLLHKSGSVATESKDAAFASKTNMCAVTRFSERKVSLLPHMKLNKKSSGARAARGSDLKAFLADVTPLRKKIAAESRRRNEVRGSAVQSVVAGFQSSCHLDFKKFLPEIKRQAARHHIPAESLLAMMTIESGGDCFASVAEGGTDPVNGKPLFSRGLFQIHANFTKLQACSSEQKEAIQHAKSVTQLRRGPRCVENPVLNLATAVQVLEDKARALVKNSEPYEIYYLNEAGSKSGQQCWMKKWIKVSGFDAKRFKDKNGHWNRHLWRMAISAYNGGERWVFRAKRNIEAFNSLHGTKVDPYNWDSLKDYYFRRTLNHRQQLRYFGSQERDRDLDYAILNVIYAENLVPGTKSKKFLQAAPGNLAELWQDGYLRSQTLQKRIPASKTNEHID